MRKTKIVQSLPRTGAGALLRDSTRELGETRLGPQRISQFQIVPDYSVGRLRDPCVNPQPARRSRILRIAAWYGFPATTFRRNRVATASNGWLDFAFRLT